MKIVMGSLPVTAVASVDYSIEAEKILRALLSPLASEERWARKLIERPELAAAIRELEYQLASAEERGRQQDRDRLAHRAAGRA